MFSIHYQDAKVIRWFAENDVSLSIKTRVVAAWCFAGVLFALAQSISAQQLTFEDIKRLPVPGGGQRFSYGSDPFQFGELRLPEGRGPHPVVIVIHGGCWYSEYDLNQLGNFNGRLTELGVATWSLEYRRIGNPGGGWPGTFADVAQGADHLRVLARTFPLDLNRVIVIGHSAGGHLALWLAARHRLPAASALYSKEPLKVRGVVSLAGITDLRRFRPNCRDAVTKLLGGSPEEVAERYEQTSPIELLPLGVKQRLILGAVDGIVPAELGNSYQTAARKKGDRVDLTLVAGAGHFDLIASQSFAWPAVVEAIRSLLELKGR